MQPPEELIRQMTEWMHETRRILGHVGLGRLARIAALDQAENTRWRHAKDLGYWRALSRTLHGQGTHRRREVPCSTLIGQIRTSHSLKDKGHTYQQQFDLCGKMIWSVHRNVHSIDRLTPNR